MASLDLADEIVDSFHGFDKKDLLDRFKAETYRAIEEGIRPKSDTQQFSAGG